MAVLGRRCCNALVAGTSEGMALVAQFLDGPAGISAMDLRRCPTYLRLVHGTRWDALDQPGDTPEPGETLAIYKIVEGTWGVVFVRPGGRYEYGDYRHVPDVSDELLEVFRERWPFLVWAMLHHARGTTLGGLPANVIADILREPDLTAFEVRRLAPLVGALQQGGDMWALADPPNLQDPKVRSAPE